MTFGVVGREHPFMAQMIALACEATGHECLLLKDLAHVTPILNTFRVDVIVLDVQAPAAGDLDWIEGMVPSRPDLPARTLLLANSELTPAEAARAKKLGADVVSRPCSFVDIKRVVMECSQKQRAGVEALR